MIYTEPVLFDIEFDSGAAVVHLGLIALSTDQTTEADFQRLLPVDSGAMFYTSRVTTVNPVTIENLRKMGPQLADSAALILPDLSLRAIAYSCTSGTIALGYDEIAKQVKSGLPKASREQVQVVTPLTAAIDAFKTLGIGKIAMLTPYVDSVNQPMKDYFEAEGVEVLKLKSLLVESDVDICRVQPKSIVKGALEAYTADADAVFVSCTALRAVECIAELEDKLGKPVLSSNLCMFWQLMKAAEYRRSISGFGQLLESHL